MSEFIFSYSLTREGDRIQMSVPRGLGRYAEVLMDLDTARALVEDLQAKIDEVKK